MCFPLDNSKYVKTVEKHFERERERENGYQNVEKLEKDIIIFMDPNQNNAQKM